MYLEKRSNGAYYLHESKWDPAKKKPRSRTIYLGKNAEASRAKLRTITDNPELLKQIVEDYEYQCDEVGDAIINSLDNHIKSCDYDNIKSILLKCVIELERLWIIRREDGGTHQECPKCRHYRQKHCGYFQRQLSDTANPYPCRAFQTRKPE